MSAAHAASLSEASPAELERIIQQTPAQGVPDEALLRRAEALYRLGDLQGDLAQIRAGADLSRQVLAHQESGSHGALWVAANKNLGTALVMLARRSNDQGQLDQAIAAFDAAVVFARDSVPEEWPGLINSLAIAQWSRGSMARDPAMIRKATATFRSALEQDKVPVGDRDRMRIEVNLASALVELSSLSKNDQPLDEAVDRFSAALDRVGRLDMPSQKAIIEGNLGQALTVRGWGRKSTADLERSVDLTKQAIDYWESVGATDARSEAEANLRQTYQLLTQLYESR
ncbi:MAG: hypothetical protein GC201_06985 [Alphaproteobacteria bacterium]|nr:hypothetical protein [Alphaproteobacteria bacterium]